MDYSNPAAKFSKETVLAKRIIRSLRLQHSMTVEEGAEFLGMGRKNLEDLESVAGYGKREISLTQLSQIAKKWSVDISYFTNRKNSLPVKALKEPGL